MGSREEWAALALQLRGAPDVYAHPALPRLWELAREDGPKMLASFRRSGKLDEQRIADLVGDVILQTLPALPDAKNPRAYFRQALNHAACSWVTRKGPVVSEETFDTQRAVFEGQANEPDHAFVIDARIFLDALSPRERDVAIALAAGEEREDVARALGISRANLDQIVSRLRKRFREEGE